MSHIEGEVQGFSFNLRSIHFSVYMTTVRNGGRGGEGEREGGPLSSGNVCLMSLLITSGFTCQPTNETALRQQIKTETWRFVFRAVTAICRNEKLGKMTT